ncbi:RNA-directed DNA polymerase, eukaryota, reverse transcriptase zinc-binding domain protein [Tanacetum coccineum]
MGTFRSKEDDVQQISTSVFVTNFPDQFSAKDLWNTYKQYGYVVDAFIPNRKSKAEGQSNKFTGERLNNIQEEILKDKFNEDAAESTYSWKEAVVVEPNAMTKLMKKLKHLKEKIRLWNKDKGCSDVEIVNKRANVVRSLQELENLQSLEAAQKSKIKRAIEGDENSKYYHRILNKKRSQLAIRGILVDGNWIDSPHLVKREFLSHFKNCFDHPQDSHLHLDLNFPNTLQPDQIIDLECDVSKDKIKRAVWDCGSREVAGP